LTFDGPIPAVYTVIYDTSPLTVNVDSAFGSQLTFIHGIDIDIYTVDIFITTVSFLLRLPTCTTSYESAGRLARSARLLGLVRPRTADF